MIRPGALWAVAIAANGCNWVSLGKSALTYETIRAGEAANVVVLDSLAYATLADSGLRVIDASTGRALATVRPPAGSESVDDLALHGRLLFVLDARPPGHLSVLSLRDPLHPVLVSGPLEVPVGPFSGVSASDALAVVSGGTSALTLWRYDSLGALEGGGPIATTDLGRGQPDVLVATSGVSAFVSTHYWGPYFGLDVIRFTQPGTGVEKLASLALDGAGFTAGGSKPANFPIESAQLDDSTLLVASARGLTVVNVRHTSAPRLERTIDLGGRAVNVDAAHGAVAVGLAAPRAAIVLLDGTSRSLTVVRRITMPPGTNPSAVALSKRTVVIAARGQGVLVFER